MNKSCGGRGGIISNAKNVSGWSYNILQLAKTDPSKHGEKILDGPSIVYEDVNSDRLDKCGEIRENGTAILLFKLNCCK